MGPLPKRRHSTRRAGNRQKATKAFSLQNLVKKADGTYQRSHRMPRPTKAAKRSAA